MAFIKASVLTGAQQAAVDIALTAILVEWPGLEYGEFEPSGGLYDLRITRRKQGEDSGEAQALANRLDAIWPPDSVPVPSKEKDIQNFDSLDGKLHFDITWKD